MGVYEGRGQLTKGIKNLMMRWQETRSSWNDAATNQFEKKYLVPLEIDLRNALGAMDHMASVLSQVRRDTME